MVIKKAKTVTISAITLNVDTANPQSITTFNPLLLHPNQFFYVIPSAACLCQNPIFSLWGQLRGSGEDPEVFVGAAANQDPLVIWVQEEDAVVAVEEPEEGDAQDSGSVGELGFALCNLLNAVFEPSVQDSDAAVARQRIIGLAVGNPPLKPMIKPRDLKPVAKIFLKVYAPGHGIICFHSVFPVLSN